MNDFSGNSDRPTFIWCGRELTLLGCSASINGTASSVPPVMAKGLTGRKLNKTAGITCRATDDLREHLKLDNKNGVLQIFHQTAFLKEHLRLTKDEQRNLPLTDSFKK